MINNKYDLIKIQNNSGFCEFDHDTRTATIKVHYKDVDEIIDKKRSTTDHPVVLSSVLDYIEEILEDIPDKYKVNFSVTIDDCGEYNGDSLIKAYKNAYYDVYSKNKVYYESANVWYIILFIVGTILICLRILGEKFGWFGTAKLVSTEIIIYLIALISEIFFEEGFMFYTIGKFGHKLYNKTLHNVDSLLLCNRDNLILSSLNMRDFAKKHLKKTIFNAFTRNYVLFFGPAFLFMFIIQAVEQFAIANTIPSIFFFLYLFGGILVIWILISNLCFYLDKRPLSSFSLPVSLCLLVLLIAIFIFMILQVKTSPILMAISIMNLLGLSINILFLALQKR